MRKELPMGTLATAYSLAGIAVAAYCVWLAYVQHDLRQRLSALETRPGEETSLQAQSRAA